MPEKKEPTSMYKIIETLDEHGNRISALETLDDEKTEMIKMLETQFVSIKTDFTNLENTIWKTAQSTQDHFSAQNAQQWKLIETLNSGNQKEKERKHELTKTKLDKFWEFAGKLIVILLGSGGFFYVLLEMASK